MPRLDASELSRTGLENPAAQRPPRHTSTSSGRSRAMSRGLGKVPRRIPTTRMFNPRASLGFMTQEATSSRLVPQTQHKQPYWFS